jgi:hypothetical protein
MGEVIRFIPKSERERARLIREARAIYDSIFPATGPVSEQKERVQASHAISGANAPSQRRESSVVIKIIAVLCSLSSPANCHEQIVTTSDFADSQCGPA